MEDIVALLARQAQKAFVEAQKNAAADAERRKAAIDAAKRQAAQTWGTPSGAAPGAPSAKPTSPAQARVVQVVRVPSAVSPMPPAPPVAPTIEPLAIEPLAIEPLVLPTLGAQPAHASVALLTAFGGGTSLLAGIVLSEALAPPISLRGAQLFDRLER